VNQNLGGEGQSFDSANALHINYLCFKFGEEKEFVEKPG
jgi:hypothetical protein